jgi:hypothetical protein
MVPVLSSNANPSCPFAEFGEDFAQAVSVRYVNGTCSAHPDANFFLIWSGIDISTPVTVAPWMRLGRFNLVDFTDSPDDTNQHL